MLYKDFALILDFQQFLQNEENDFACRYHRVDRLFINASPSSLL